jgi:hypothetical protein
MTNLARRVLLIACSLSLAACAANQFSKTQSLVNGVSLKGSRVFVYSFLDIRDNEFGLNMLTEVDKQLTQALQKSDVTARVLRFRDSETGKYFPLLTNGGVSIPIRQTFASNATAEQELGADYRLVIFPKKMTLSGAWKFYEISWELISTKSGERVWMTTSQGKHINAWKNDEDPVERAKTIVDGIVVEMRKSQLM